MGIEVAAGATNPMNSMVGFGTAYAGSNIGEEPTIWTTFGRSCLAMDALLGLWVLIEAFGRVSDAISLECDTASGLRLAAFFGTAGLILGRAVARELGFG